MTETEALIGLVKMVEVVRKSQTIHIFNVLRTLKAKNPGDNYYEEYLKHYKREGDKFYDQYHVALTRVMKDPPKKILEIGTRTGLSICNMLSAYLDYSVLERVVLVDIWADGFASPEIVKMNLRALNIPIDKIEFLWMSSEEAMPGLVTEQFDYILVDGDHEKAAARKDLENVVPLCAPGGQIVFDDITEHGCNLQDVWNAFMKDHPDEFLYEENHKGKGVGWAIKK